MADVYSFTTVEEDRYMDRVAEEADPDKNFFFVKETNTGNESANLYLLIRENYLDELSENYPNEKLGGRTLGEIRLMGLETTFRLLDGFRVLIIPDLTKQEKNHWLVRLHNEVRRLKNLAEGRTLRVQVESL